MTTQETLDVDAVVLGAGPTGLTAACILADQGLKVALVESKPGSGDEPRAISATDETLRVMQQLGVLTHLEPDMLLDTGALYTGRSGQVLAEVHPARQRLGQPGKNQFDQPAMEGCLFDGVCARPGITRLFGTRAEHLSQDADGVRLTVQGPRQGRDGFRGDARADADFASSAAQGRDDVLAAGVGQDERARQTPEPDTVTTVVRAPWMIACDGGKSFTRNSLGIKLEGSTQVEKWIVLDLLGAGEPEPYATFSCNGARPTVIVPGVKGRRRYEFMLFPGEDEDTMLSTETLRELVAPYQDLDRLQVRRAAVYTAQQRVASRWIRGRVLLAGDAAHLMPPFAGQGLNAGIRDAVGAAWRIAAVVNGQATTDVLASYEQERRPHATQMVKLSKGIGSIVMSTNPLVCRLRDLVIPALGIFPKAKSWVTSMKFLKQPDYSDGFVLPVASDVPTGAARLLGRSLPQPEVISDTTEVGKLDDRLGDGFAWISVVSPGRVHVRHLDGQEVRLRTVGGAVDASVLDPAVGYSLLLRPDRYIAAVVPLGEENRAAEALAPVLPVLRTATPVG